MTVSTKSKQSLVGIELVRLLAYEGDRIFTTERARELAPRVGLKDSYLTEALYHLRKNDWIVSLRRGLYALSPTVPGVAAAHEFEIATALVDPAMISHWSALHHHGLTEQIPRDVFVLTTTDAWVPRPRKEGKERAGGGFVVGDTTYRFIQVKPDRFFGGENLWVGEARVPMSDLERTLLDCLSMPQHCGGFGEALYCLPSRDASTEHRTHHRVRHQAGRDHSQALGVGARSPRGSARFELEELAALPIKGYRKLDPTGPRKGPCNGRWMVQENLPRMVEA